MNKAVTFTFLFLLISTASLQANNCLFFDGSDDYITLDDQFSFGGAYTIEAWFCSQAPGEQTILSATNGNNHGIIVGLENSDRYRFLHRDPTGASSERNLEVSTGNSFVNNWHHIAAVFDGATSYIYLDGSEIGRVSGATPFTASFDITLGRLLPINPVRHFNGMIDELRIWGAARSQADIQEWMNNELAGNESGLKAYYTFEQSSGDVLDDISSNGNDATLHNFTLPDAWVTSPAPVSPHPQDPPSGNYLHFDGVNDFVEIPDADVLDLTGEMTIETWVRLDALPTETQCLFSKSSYALTLSADSLFSFTMGNGTLTCPWEEPTCETWNHLAVTCAADSARMYLNGEEIAVGAAGSIFPNTSPLRLSNSAGPLVGGLDEFRVWNVVRTQQEIRNNRYTFLPCDEPGLVAYYRFNQGDAGGNNTGLPSQLVDYTNNHNGVLHHFALTGASSNWLSSGGEDAVVISTTGVDNITATSADVSGELYSQGEIILMGRGVCYSTINKSPTVADDTVDETLFLAVPNEPYTMSLTGLLARHTYYARAYVVNTWEKVYGEVCQFTTPTSPNSPNIQAHDLTFTYVDSTQVDIRWVNGDGENRAVFMLQGDDGIAAPVENTTYAASSVFGMGDEIGDTGWYCIYNGAGSSVTVTGLTANTTYRVMVCEYNLSPGAEAYNVSTATANPSNASTRIFNNIGAGIIGVRGYTVWGDYDNDGDLDVFVSGYFNNPTQCITCRIYRNDNGAFTNVSTGLTDFYFGAAAWGDYDNDGDLDIVITGREKYITHYRYRSKIFRNDAGAFTDINAGLPGVEGGSVAWGDYDNDGDLDLLLTGMAEALVLHGRVFRNDNGVFTDIDAGLQSVFNSSAEWGDYDNDGDLDILLTGRTLSHAYTKIYRNHQGTFTDTGDALPGVGGAGAAWGDYDNDGDLDILLTGYASNGERISRVYGNDRGTFSDIGAGLLGLDSSKAIWGDYDCDGDLDILQFGEEYINDVCVCHFLLYRNDNGVFTSIDHGIPDARFYDIDWCDYDNDGDQDIMMTGSVNDTLVSRLYRNNLIGGAYSANTPPTAPTNCRQIRTDDGFALHWDAATDAETPAAGLTYNLRGGFESEGIDIISPMADLSDGWRMIPAMGGQNHSTQWKLYGGSMRHQAAHSFSVQAVDSSLMGSAFSDSCTFIPYASIESEEELAPDGVLSWETQIKYWSLIDSYQAQIDDDSTFASPVVDAVLSQDVRGGFAPQEPTLTASSQSTPARWRSQKRKAIDTVSSESAAIDTLSTINADTGARSVFLSVQLSQLANSESLQDGAVYYWRVRPLYNDGVESVFTVEEKSFLYNSLNRAPNSPIGGFMPANDDPVASLTPMISWGNATDPDANDYADLLRYVVELDTLDTFTGPTLADTTAMGVTFVQLAAPLASGNRYYYRVKTLDDENAASAWSATQQFVTLMPPQNVTISASEGGVTLAWNDMPFATRNLVYTVYSSSDPNAVFPDEWAVEAVNLGATSWQDTNVIAPMKFYRITVGGAARSDLPELSAELME